MILTTYDSDIHGALLPNLAHDWSPDSKLGDIFQVVEQDQTRVFVQFERFVWESLEKDAIALDEKGSGIWIRYFASDAEISTLVNALKVSVHDYLDVFYLEGAAIEFFDAEMGKKKFAEIVHGFRKEEHLEPFLKLQWQPSRSSKGIRFIFQPKR